MAKKAAQTGIMPMAVVAAEQFFPERERILNDDLAYRMLSPGAKVFACLLKPRWVRNWMINMSEQSQRGIWGGMLCRKRYIDEKITESSSRMEAIVNLGAGFDTRAYRLTALSGLPIWEVDQPVNIAAKEKRLRSIFEKIPEHINLVAIDFDHQDLASSLAEHGHLPGNRTFFVCEAVTQYLTERGIKTLFDFLAHAAAGSRLAFTYVRQDFLDGRNLYGWESGYKRFVLSKIWLSAMVPEAVPGFLNEYGWKILEHIGYDEMAEKYIKPTHRHLTSTPVERMVYAEKPLIGASLAGK